MLQFTLNELYQKRSGQVLTQAAYRELGGLSGSIATTAQAVLLADDDSQLVAPRVFRSLVSVDDAGRATRRYAALAELWGDAARERLLQQFIDARLSVTDQREGQAVVAFAHDTLLHTLPALTEWLKKETGLLQTPELAQRETQSWQQHTQSDGLAGGGRQDHRVRGPGGSGQRWCCRTRFVPSSTGPAWRVRRARRIERIAIGVIAILGCGVIVGAVAPTAS